MSETISLSIHKEEKSFLPIDTIINLDVNRILVTPFYHNKIIFGSIKGKHKVVAKIQSIPEKDPISVHEWKALCTAFEHGVAVPTPITLAKDKENRIILLMEQVDGPLLYDDPQPEWIQKFGETIGTLHKITLNPETLDQSDRLNMFFFQDWELKLRQDEYFIKNSDELKILDELSVKSRDCFQVEQSILLHYDLHHSQAIINLANKHVVLIDFERWRVGDPAYDIAIYLYHLIRQNQPIWCFEKFLSGYQKSRAFKITVELESLLQYYLFFTSARAVYLFRDRPSWRQRSTLTHQKVLEYIKTDQLKQAVNQVEY